MPPLWLRPFYSDDDGQPQGGDAEKSRVTDVLERYGRDAIKLADKLNEALNDNYSLREKNRALRADKAALEKSQAPEGSVVLAKEQAAQWEAYTALGDPGKLKTDLDAAATATADLATLRRTETIRAAAEAHGYRAAALGKLPSLADKELTKRDVQEDGKTVARYFVDDKPLADYIAANDPELMGALKDTSAAPPPGTAFLSQGGANDQSSGDLASRFIAQQEARRANEKNALMR